METNFVKQPTKHELYEVAFWYESKIIVAEFLISTHFGAISLN